MDIQEWLILGSVSPLSKKYWYPQNWTLIKTLAFTVFYVLCSGSNRRIWCREEQSAVPLHQKRVQPWQSHDHRGGVQHTDGAAQWLHHQSPDLGHGRAGAIPGHHFCVSVKTHHSFYRSISTVYTCVLILTFVHPLFLSPLLAEPKERGCHLVPFSPIGTYEHVKSQRAPLF